MAALTGDALAPSSSDGRAKSNDAIHSVCAFWLRGRCFALDIRLVSEVVTIDAFIPVPKTPAELVGLFNLRGTPVAIVDLAAVLGLGASPEPEPVARDHEHKSAFVLRSGGTVAALVVERMEMVFALSDGVLTAADTRLEHPVVLGFFEAKSRGGLMVTLLDGSALLSRLDKLKINT